MAPAQKKPRCPCAAGGSMEGFPGYKCSLCCSIFSVWGVIMLSIFAGSLQYSGVRLDAIKNDDLKVARIHVIIAAVMYLGFVIGCGIRWVYLQHMKRVNPLHPGL